jgi:nicotinamidase-related amidase
MHDFISPDNKHSALIIIDVQRDFALSGSNAEIPGTMQAVQYIQILANGYRNLCHPIIHVVRLYHQDGSNVDLCRRAAIMNGKQMVIAGNVGAEIVDELKPSTTTRLDSSLLLSGRLQHIGPMEWIMYKPRWGAFYRTPLEEHLRDLSVNTVIIAGCNFPNCPRTTTYEANERDFRIVLAQDATSQIYEKDLKELNSIGISIMDTSKCIDWLGLQKSQ